MGIFGPMLDVRELFPVERREMLELLGSLSPVDWSRKTVCPGWDVHDVVGHVLNDYLRRLSGSRDGFPGAVFTDDETLPLFLARTNDEFVRATRQCSPQVMIDLLTYLGPQLDQLWARTDLIASADLQVSWAGPDASPAWLDIAREYTEFWVHQQQIRDAVDRPGANHRQLLHPVIDTFMRALPHTLGGCDYPDGAAVLFVVHGDSGGRWNAIHNGHRWQLNVGPAPTPTAEITMSAQDVWRLATRGISVAEARGRAHVRGDPTLIDAATSLLAVVA